jgi:AcrR family transcriptional regulator
VLLAPRRKPLRTSAAADPMPRAKQRTPELRDRVLLHAIDLLARDGAAGFTARRIAREAATSIPAVYELFGDKAGLLREVFFEGFRLLRQRLDELPRTADPRADLIALADAYRDFIHKHPVLAQLMFSRPFADFDPGESELRAGASVRKFIVERVRAAIDAGVLHGDATDVSLILVATVQGLAAADRDSRLGSSRGSIDRRWRLAIDALVAGFGSGLGA